MLLRTPDPPGGSGKETSLDPAVLIRLPTEMLKVHQFQICCARTKHLSEIHKSETIVVCAAKLLLAKFIERVKCQKLGEDSI